MNSNACATAQSASLLCSYISANFLFPITKWYARFGCCYIDIIWISVEDKLTCLDFFSKVPACGTVHKRNILFRILDTFFFWLINKLRSKLLWEYIFLDYQFKYFCFPWHLSLSCINKPQNWELFET